MLSQKAKYALRALTVLAGLKAGEQAQIAQIADEARVPRKFLEQILLDLKKRGLVHSTRGKLGGYVLGRPAAAIELAEVIRTIDGPLAMSPCASRMAYRKCDDCDDAATCEIRKVLLAVRDATAAILEARTLESILGKPARSKRATTQRRSAP
ncbi:MAG TPA: Rrf2 family transcriptional regulator [Pseudomonadales bacterium]